VVAVETVAASVVSLLATPLDSNALAVKPPAEPRTLSLAITPAKRGRINLCLPILPLGYRHPRTLSILNLGFWKKIAAPRALFAPPAALSGFRHCAKYAAGLFSPRQSAASVGVSLNICGASADIQ